MTKDFIGLHSHSGLERELNMRNDKVLIDVKFMPMFGMESIGETFTRKGITYVEVNTGSFVRKGGIFKCFTE